MAYRKKTKKTAVRKVIATKTSEVGDCKTPLDVVSTRINGKIVRFKLVAVANGVDVVAVKKTGEPRQKSNIIKLTGDGKLYRYGDITDKCHLKKNDVGQILMLKSV